jgi:DNA-binding CsgD family transcriptional regulator
METKSRDYRLFFDFISKYLPGGFQNIDPDSPLMLNLEKMMETNHQFFLIGNLIHMKVIYTSKKSKDLIGIEPENVDPASFLNSVHPDDLTRLVLSRTKLLTLGVELFVAKKGIAVISSTLRFQGSSGNYINQLVQCYLFYAGAPFSTVFILQVNTDISQIKKIRHGYHYYTGDDVSFFRYPDESLLLIGNIFSDREFEIIKLVSEGLNSEQIANKIFLSVHTIETHRRNILKKSNKSSIVELILDLKNRGLL